ncbi:MAG: OmpH family outer membrane protein [Spirochaetia bacterium]|jgi:outer membrane protein|nr:OmpH family outer membrane protein [Spirochaetia bacterium]
MKKKLLVMVLLFSALSLYPQQITKIGIINYSKVISSISGDSRALQEIERLIKSYEEGVAAIKNDITALEERKLYYTNLNNEMDVLKMDEQINKKQQYLKEYSRLKLANIEERKKRMMMSTEFLGEILDKIENIAETEGFSVIMNSRDPDLIWWSHSVDITDKVIEKINQVN